MSIDEKILFKSKVGSFLYGTNNENSDLDIKGVFLPKIEELILGNASKHYVINTSNGKIRNTKDDIDETYYSLQYFLELAAKGETNALDLLFAYTNSNAVLYIDDVWKDLINNLDKIVTKNVNSYLGYCKSQCIKYSIKGEKLSNFKEFENFLLKYKMDKNIHGTSILLKDALKKEEPTILSDNFIDRIGVGKENREKLNFSEFANFNFGNHCYFEKSKNKEIYLTISDIKFCIYEDIIDCIHKLERTISSYGKRAEAASIEKADYKAISHCVRVLFQTEELLTTGRIIFPLKEAEFVKSIKYNTSKMSYDEIMAFIENQINYIDSEIIPKSQLRDKADYKFIEEFILKQYR